MSTHQADTGQRCPHCGEHEGHWEYTGRTDQDGDAETFLVCRNCDYGCGPYEDAMEQIRGGEEDGAPIHRWQVTEGYDYTLDTRDKHDPTL